MQIPVTTVLPGGARPPQVVMNRLRESSALAGCPWCPGMGLLETDYSGRSGGGGWGETLQQVAEDWSRISGQLLLNRNPAPIYKQTAAGTTIYAQTGAPVQPASTSGWVVPALLVGGVVLLAVMFKNR